MLPYNASDMIRAMQHDFGFPHDTTDGPDAERQPRHRSRGLSGFQRLSARIGTYLAFLSL